MSLHVSLLEDGTCRKWDLQKQSMVWMSEPREGPLRGLLASDVLYCWGQTHVISLITAYSVKSGKRQLDIELTCDVGLGEQQLPPRSSHHAVKTFFQLIVAYIMVLG